ncbi:hypothetical protein RF11_04352 [Thelohanellus kitauei]|uniref:Zinc finger BED domain-containing protein 5 n=1 Tax=Thelohanellus kitauei TaxID=669202 RepID=A0A0C2NEU3_THEKT|nr:hypothetical protein RF11_04352 [Thelohanellus kitauei]
MCRETESKHKHLLLHREVCWLSRGRVVQHVYELRDDLLIFLNQHNQSMAQFITYKIWVARLDYLADIFNILNRINLSLQDPDTNVLKCMIKSMPSGRKFAYGRDNVLDYFLTVGNISTAIIAGTVLNHLQQLLGYFYHYFGDEDVSELSWIRNPFE